MDQTKYLLTVLPMENSPALNKNIIQRNLDHLDILQNFTLTNFINDIISIGPNEQKMVSIQKVLVRDMMGPEKIQGPDTFIKFSGVQWLRTY